MKKIFLILMVFVSFQTNAQKKAIELTDIWQNYTFYPKSVENFNWMNDSRFYTNAEDNNIKKYEVATGKELETLATLPFEVGSYELNDTEDKILILTQKENIYRRSFKANYFVFDMKTKKNVELSKNGKQSYATLSPDGSKVAFVRENNLFLVHLADMQEEAITTDGKFNAIINGACDWVYEEEFGFAQAFFWSPDSKKIAFYNFDERGVKEYNMQRWKGLYPEDYKFKYPKAGEANSKVGISVFYLDTKSISKVALGQETDIYIPRIKWTKNPDLLSIRRLNRLQNNLEIIHANVKSNETKVILTENSKTYVDVEFTDDLTYLQNGKEFIHSSEKSGFKHLYLFDMNGKELRAITKGNWELSKIEGLDEKLGVVYFSSPQETPLESQLYAVSLKGGEPKKITTQKGWNSIGLSKDSKFFINNFSSASQPPMATLHEISGKKIKDLETNEALANKLKNYKISPKEFFNFKTPEGTALNGWMIKPQNFEASKKYPVLMFVYGGPGSQEVKNDWDTFDFFWYQTLANKGYMVACVDNRGTGGRGEAFRKATYKQLGKLEVQDQIEAAKYLGNLPFVDKTRIGIWGWSYGGYMAGNCIMQGADIFKAAISVAPVSNWRFYDTIYTERYLQRPQDNPSGYDDNSPITHVSKLKGNYLLVHGTGDDNVHFQNAVALQDALIKAGKQFQTFYYPNKNHGIYGENTRLHLYQMLTNFLEKNL